LLGGLEDLIPTSGDAPFGNPGHRRFGRRSSAGGSMKKGTPRAKPPRTFATRSPRKEASRSSPKAAIQARPAARTASPVEPAARLIDRRIRELVGWRGETLARMRALILGADRDATEEWKWGTPVWSHHGIICTGEAYTMVVKLTFARGASLPDPSRLFNASLEGTTRRAIDIHEGEQVDEGAFRALVKAAVARNGSPAARPAR
jgi:hypothetical protein